MKLVVLGASAGGGSPQWNCRCAVCERVRRGGPGVSVRTQSSVAVSADGERWAILEASPDLSEQLRRERRLWPPSRPRSSPVGAVVVTDGDVDHLAGLLSLREGHPFGLYATRALLERLDASPIFGVLDPERVSRRALALDEARALEDGAGKPLGLWVRPFGVPGKVPLWAEDPSWRGDPTRAVTDAVTEEVVGVEVGDDHGRRFFFVPSCAAVTPDLAARLRGAGLVLFDGTVWEDDEMVQQEVGHKTGRRMGHLPLAGPGGTLEAFRPLDVRRKVLIHLNNTNPVLLPDTEARRRVEAAGWEVAYDGMELEVG